MGYDLDKKKMPTKKLEIFTDNDKEKVLIQSLNILLTLF